MREVLRTEFKENFYGKYEAVRMAIAGGDPPPEVLAKLRAIEEKEVEILDQAADKTDDDRLLKVFLEHTDKALSKVGHHDTLTASEPRVIRSNL